MQVPNVQPTSVRNAGAISDIGSVTDRFASPEKHDGLKKRIQGAMLQKDGPFSAQSHVRDDITGKACNLHSVVI